MQIICACRGIQMPAFAPGCFLMMFTMCWRDVLEISPDTPSQVGIPVPGRCGRYLSTLLHSPGEGPPTPDSEGLSWHAGLQEGLARGEAGLGSLVPVPRPLHGAETGYE